MLRRLRSPAVAWVLILIAAHFQEAQETQQRGQADSAAGQVGRFGGNLVISERSEPKTLNPLVAEDGTSREIIGLLDSDLIHINRYTHLTEASLAESWNVSPDGLRYTVHLRKGLRFSDGQPCDADDVVFTFQSYLNEKVHSSQRDLLVIAGKPIEVRKLDKYTIIFTLRQPYSAGDRLFDSIAILPRHLLQHSSDEGHLATAWQLNTPSSQIAGLGPFRLKEYVPGQRLILERNPNYWKRDSKGQSLPYLANISCVFAANADAEAMRFEAGETDVISRLSAANYGVLEKDQGSRGFHLYDLGPGLEYSFLFFNQNAAGASESPALVEKQAWFQKLEFRQAISDAVDRDDIVRIAYAGRARPLAVQVTPGNKRWINPSITVPSRSIERARSLMRSGGFRWTSEGTLVDWHGKPVELSLAVNAGNPQQVQMATLIEQDLKELGVHVLVDMLDFHTLLDRIFKSYRYEAALMTLADGDADPNSEVNVLTSGGSTHVWSLKPETPLPPYQVEIDKLMHEQLSVVRYEERKRIYDHVQILVRDNVPVVYLVSPDILVGAKDRVKNFKPAILSSYTLWNAEQLFVNQEHAANGHP